MPDQTVYMNEIELKIMRLFVESGILDDKIVIEVLEDLSGKLKK
jgi:hypothetical protein